MSNLYKIAGQAAPTANSDTVLYTVPALKNFISSTLALVNRNTSGVISSYRIAVVPAGESLANRHYIEFDALVDGRGSKRLTLGMTLSAGDTVVVRSSSGDMSFTLFGTEQS